MASSDVLIPDPSEDSLLTLSPAATKSFSIQMRENILLAVASFKKWAPIWRLAARICSYSASLDKNAFLLNEATCTPAPRNAGYTRATSCEAAMPTRIALWVRLTSVKSSHTPRKSR